MPARVTRARTRRNDENPAPAVSKHKTISKVKKTVRAPLADRTNSASDENTSGQGVAKKRARADVCERPRRVLRAPARLADHETAFTAPLTSVSPEKVKTTPVQTETPTKSSVLSPFKTPQTLNTSLVVPRPRRIQRLPSRFSDHSLSPSKFVPVKPGWASTPIPAKEKADSKTRNRKIATNVVQEKTERVTKKAKANDKKSDSNNNPQKKECKAGNQVKVNEPAPIPVKELPVKPSAPSSPKKRSAQEIKPTVESPIEKKTSDQMKTVGRVYSPKLPSYRKESPEIKEKLAIYEFTFDPNEEPDIPKKKKKKQPVRKKAAPRRIIIKENYSTNVAKQLESLKNIISKKTTPIADLIPPVRKTAPKQPQPIIPSKTTERQKSPMQDKVTQKPLESLDHYDDQPICYSPIPHQDPETDIGAPTTNPTPSNGAFLKPPARSNDPLNLIEDFSFFDDVPVACSSLRKSAAASPWRVDLQVQSKWPVNMYVKPNMTPAYESSFANVDIDYEATTNDKPPESGLFTDRNETGGLKQTSILSFIKEVAEKQAHKKVATPTKDNSIFGVSSSSSNASHASSDQQVKSLECTPVNNATDNQPSNTHETASNKDPASNADIVPLVTEKLVTPEKHSPRKCKKKGSSKYFGFDDSEDIEDQENVSPQKKIKLRGARVLRTRPVLKDLNQQRPMRMTVPVRPFAPTSAVVAKLYEEIKSIPEAPIEPPAADVEAEKNESSDSSLETSAEASVEINKEKSISPPVGLFEDVEVVHYPTKPRKSYGGKARKVTFQQSSTMAAAAAAAASDGDVTDDSDFDGEPSFALPELRQRQPTKRKKKVTKMSKKEAEEAEAWAAGFNSMIEEVDEFPLVIE